MAEITLYSPWTMKLAFPYDFEKVMEMANVKRISYKTEDCSRYNKRTQGKSAKLHPPTISALLKLILMKNGKTEGACGIQKQENVNYFLMEYEKPKERCILVYNRKNGRFIGQRITENGEERLVPVENGISNGEEYLAVLAYASTLPVSPLYDEEFAYHFLVLEKQYLNHWDVPKEAINAAYICCDNLYRRITAPPEEAIPLEQVQFQVNGKMDFLVGYKVKLGVYEPNDQIWGTFRYLKAHPNSRARQCTIADMKKIYSCGWEITSGSKDKIPTLPETYRVSEDAEEILQRIIDTPARMFMITGGAGGGKTTDAKIIAQVLGLPYYVFTCGPDTDELSLLASTVPNVGKEEVNPPEYPLLEDMMMDPATALSMVSGTYQEGISQETAFRELLKAVYQQGYEQAKKEKDFLRL